MLRRMDAADDLGIRFAAVEAVGDPLDERSGRNSGFWVLPVLFLLTPARSLGGSIPRNKIFRIEPLTWRTWVGRGVLTAPRARLHAGVIRGGLRTARPTLRERAG